MGLRQKRPKTQQQKSLEQTQTDLLDAQELAANQFEQNQKLQTIILDTQELLANIVEGGNK